ncbi:MAG: methylmalonyl-CoA mutase family protein [Flavobacteriales bacterium]
MFKDFEKQSPLTWKEKIITDLKGGNYEDLLVWKSDEGITVEPLYTKENRSSNSGVLFKNATWNIVDRLVLSEEKKDNAVLLETLNWGSSSIFLDVTKVEKLNPEILFKDIAIDCIECIVDCNLNQSTLISTILEYIKTHFDLDKINFKVNFNSFHQYYKSGHVSSNLSEELKCFLAIQNQYTNPNIKLFGIDLRYLQNAGARMIDQLAYSLAIAQLYVDVLDKSVLSHIGIFTSTASNFFFEISKLRAFRKLWAYYSKSYEVEDTLWIFAENSTKNKTVFDPYVNMLRTGSETLSNVIGGADSIYTQPFDAVYKNRNTFSNRIARNQQILIQGESYFDKVADVANGAYYIEHLTQELEQKAFDKFKDIDALGWLNFLNGGNLKSELELVSQTDKSNFDDLSKPLLGTNLYPNLEETMSEDIEIDIDPYKSYHIKNRRISIASELERLAQEKQK